MKEINLDALVTPVQKVILGGREFYIKDMVLAKAFEATDKYQKMADYLVESGGLPAMEKDARVTKKYSDKIMEVCLFILKNQLRYSTVREWISTLWLNATWMKKNANVKQTDELIQEVLKPIIGDEVKKKLKVLKDQIANKISA